MNGGERLMRRGRIFERLVQGGRASPVGEVEQGLFGDIEEG